MIGSIIDQIAGASASIALRIRRGSVGPRTPVGSMVFHVDLELLACPPPFVVLPPAGQVEALTGSGAHPACELRTDVNEAEDHASQVGEIAYRSTRLERSQEGNGSEDRHHDLAFIGNR